MGRHTLSEEEIVGLLVSVDETLSKIGRECDLRGFANSESIRLHLEKVSDRIEHMNKVVNMVLGIRSDDYIL